MSQTGRNRIGFVGWLLVAILLSILAAIPMVARELYQSKKYGFSLEKDDIYRYTIAILIGSAIQVVLLVIMI